MVPTLGFLDRITPQSGRLAVFTDSSCMDTSSASLTKCFWLLEKLIRLSSMHSGDSTNFTSIMSERYRLPEDYTANERPRMARLEDIPQEVEVYK